MKNIFNFIKTAPDAPPITDQKEIRSSYRYWRVRILSTITIGYIGFYFVRKSLSMAMPEIEKEFGFKKADLGLMLTLIGLTYGLSKFVNGMAGDRSNPRYFMAIGLIASAVINVFFGFSSSLLAFAIFWLLNGWFQGMGWAPCSRSLVQWFSAEERGVKFSICNCAVVLGSFSVLFLNGYLIEHYHWSTCFFVPAAIAAGISVFILISLRDRPQSLGLPPVEQYTCVQPDIGDTEGRQGEPYLHILNQYVFKNPMMWVLCMGNFFVYVIRYSILDWGPTLLQQSKSLEPFDSGWVVGLNEIAGMGGMLLGGILMDKWFRGYGGKTCAIYMVFCTLAIVAFWQLPVEGALQNGLLLWPIGFFVYGPQCLVAVVAANMVPKNAAAAAVGLTGFFGYLSTSLSGWGLGKILDTFGWNGCYLMLLISGILGILMFLLLWNVKPLHAD